MSPRVTHEDEKSHVMGLLLALADLPPGWQPLSAFDLDGQHDWGWRRYVGLVARLAAERQLVEVRRAAAGVRVRLTDGGRASLRGTPARRVAPARATR